MNATLPLDEPATDATAASAPELPQSVGQRLRAAREAAHLSIIDVAQSLKFGPRQIELLEADDYAALPGNTVVRGFTRSYAKLLKLDAAELLLLLDSHIPSASADVRPPENIGVASNPGDGPRWSPLIAATLVLAMAALLLALWHFIGPKTRPADGAVTEAQPAQVQLAPAAANAADAAPAAQAGSVQPAEGPGLNFVFDDVSWVEVTDARGRILHSSENPAGSRLTVAGKLPLDIVVGNASKVRLSYDGRVIDLAPHTRAEVARLKLEK